MEVHKFFRYRIILINVSLRSHWTLSNSEVGPRIWTCVTIVSCPDPTHEGRASGYTSLISWASGSAEAL